MSKQAKQEKSQLTDRPQQGKASQGPVFGIQSIYVEKTAFEIPKGPEIFKQEWKPKVKMDVNTKHRQLDPSQYYVLLTLQVTVKLDNTVAFMVEVEQAGIFTIQSIEGKQLTQLLEAYCPSILFPYAREMVASLVGHGRFPALHLAPIHFEALYEQKLKEQQAQTKSAS